MYIIEKPHKDNSMINGQIYDVEYWDRELSSYEAFEIYNKRPPKWHERIKIDLQSLRFKLINIIKTKIKR